MEFISYIRENHADCPGLIYRGHASAEWKTESALDRLIKRFPRTKNHDRWLGKPNPEYFETPPLTPELHVGAFKEAARGRLGENQPPLNNDEWWALAHHHGLATPMLDWTYSPFVALFFAFEDEKCMGDSGVLDVPKVRTVLSTGLAIFQQIRDESDRPTSFVPKGHASYRLTNQAGLFMKMPLGRDLESIVREHFAEESDIDDPPVPARPILERILIPDSGRVECLKFLNKMNVNRMSLFPDLDGKSKYVNGLWELGYDRMLGYVIATRP